MPIEFIELTGIFSFQKTLTPPVPAGPLVNEEEEKEKEANGSAAGTILYYI